MPSQAQGEEEIYTGHTSNSGHDNTCLTPAAVIIIKVMQICSMVNLSFHFTKLPLIRIYLVHCTKCLASPCHDTIGFKRYITASQILLDNIKHGRY